MRLLREMGGGLFLKEKVFLRGSKYFIASYICVIMSSFSVFDSKGAKFVDQSKPKFIKYQNQSFKRIVFFHLVIYVGFGPNQEVCGLWN
jgi:hypothetical protein